MATILREPGEEYRPYFDKVPLEKVANSHRQLPKEWITKDGLDVTDDFILYEQPLIRDGTPGVQINGGLQRFAQFDVTFIEKKTPAYIPVRFRG